MHRATQTSGTFINLSLTLFALFALLLGVLNVLESAFALSASSDYIAVQSLGTCDRPLALELPPMKLQNI